LTRPYRPCSRGRHIPLTRSLRAHTKRMHVARRGAGTRPASSSRPRSLPAAPRPAPPLRVQMQGREGVSRELRGAGEHSSCTAPAYPLPPCPHNKKACGAEGSGYATSFFIAPRSLPAAPPAPRHANSPKRAGVVEQGIAGGRRLALRPWDDSPLPPATRTVRSVRGEGERRQFDLAHGTHASLC
jgi:hypothetical protein